MKIVIERELDVEELFENMTDDFADYSACDDANLSNDDFTPEVMANIFSELADIATKKAARLRR